MYLNINCWNGVDGHFVKTKPPNNTIITVYKDKIVTVSKEVSGGWSARVGKVDVGYGIVIALTIIACIISLLVYFIYGKKIYKLI